jgi:peptidoglycan/LPS O-acetylase OafA/YrhL
MENKNTYLSSKPRYEILDGLRGVAALIVVAFHLFETYSKGPQYQILNHGYLAVDFFFVLSGFVIGYAYDDRWGRMSLSNFFKRRLIRLHPMVVMGCFIGLLLFYFGACPEFPLIAKTPVWKLLLMFLLGCTMFPALTSWDIRGWAETNSLNGPSWTLMYEYIANILYALIIRRLPTAILSILVVFFGFLTVNLAMNIDVFGLLQARTDAAYTVIGGWSITPEQISIGFSRLLYPFFAGLLVSRLGHLIKVKGGFWWCSLIVAVILIMPRIGGESTQWMNGLYESIAIIAIFPLVVAIGAGSNVTGKKSVEVCKFFGLISYPLYITHYPLVYIQKAWVQAHADAPIGMHIAVSVSIYIIAIVVAYAALKLYDMPLREWLKERFLHKKPKTIQQTA